MPPLRTAWAICACIAFVIAMITASWTGYLQTDDHDYAGAATGWLLHAPFLGQSHWGLRHFIVLPLAGAFAILGQGEMALAAPMLIFGVGLLLLMGVSIGAVAGIVPGLLAVVLIVSVPVFASGATTVFTDVPEALFVLASFWSFYFATRSQCRPVFVLAGLLAGCGFLTRETSVALLVPYAILFLIGYGRRGDYIWMGAGFVAIVGLDFLLLWRLSGDPLWRFHITQLGIAGDSPATPGLKGPGGMPDPFGIFALPRPVQAMIVLFASPTLGLLPWLGVPAAFWLAWSPPQGPPGTLARLFILLAACWFTVLSFALLSLWLLPRYQIVTVCALAVPAALLLGDWLNRGFRIRVAMLLIAVLGAGLVLSSAADHDLLFGERALVNFLRLQNEPVRTDSATLRGAEWLLQSAGVADRVTVGLPVSGGLYFINHSPRRAMPPDWPIQDEVPGSVVVASFTQKLGRLAIIAAALGLDRVMPVSLWRKIHPTPRRAEIVRMP